MVENLVNTFINLFSFLNVIPFGKEITVFIISLMPILELRGGILAASLLDINGIVALIICIIGNILPIPFILWFMKSILDKMRDSKHFSKIAKWLDKKVNKRKGQLEKYGYLGLILFVGIPLPGTGAWTGCLIASVLEMDKKKSLVAATIGVLMASAIMMLISYGVLKSIL